jgi:hypothetical protein
MTRRLGIFGVVGRLMGRSGTPKAFVIAALLTVDTAIALLQRQVKRSFQAESTGADSAAPCSAGWMSRRERIPSLA